MAVDSGHGHAPFCVLLGPDYAGKSSALDRLGRAVPGWRMLSLDDAHLGPEHAALIGRLRRHAVQDVAARPGTWSPEFFASLLQTAVVHLRDQLDEGDPNTPMVVDSYYYKLLAKCRLAGAPDGPPLDWWRTFPQPRRIVYLDVRPETAWRRCGFGAELNVLEHYGPQPDWDGFRRYQSDLAKILHGEIQHLPVTVIPERDRPEQTVAEIREVLTREFR
ncbi:hypothetical protein JK361_02595 [Streptomyces sp. 5-8]|uniref:Thymidylate kinase n=1 Tax=Streptomyces musisoli TaxID=2802280 RepID=A0ABS1NTS7_9ACTN|nr:MULTISPECIES: hypothetical protein [Streptomyces]MBL1103501.1 hypothetical protein [Streptomyces musisoli]MBY8839893.1 hypothetical protein [Streptomyces sp. SP2-10]